MFSLCSLSWVGNILGPWSLTQNIPFGRSKSTNRSKYSTHSRELDDNRNLRHEKEAKTSLKNFPFSWWLTSQCRSSWLIFNKSCFNWTTLDLVRTSQFLDERFYTLYKFANKVFTSFLRFSNTQISHSKKLKDIYLFLASIDLCHYV